MTLGKDLIHPDQACTPLPLAPRDLEKMPGVCQSQSKTGESPAQETGFLGQVKTHVTAISWRC